MDKRKLEVMGLIDKANNSNYLEDFESLKRKGYEAGFLKAMETEGLVFIGGAHDFHLTNTGEKILREERLIESTQNALSKSGILESIRKSTEGIQKTLGNISQLSGSIIIPKVDIPQWVEPINLVSIKSPTIITEKNNWERHKELLEIQGASLKTQEAILTEQKSTSGLTRWILGLTIAILILTGISIWLKG